MVWFQILFYKIKPVIYLKDQLIYDYVLVF